MAYRTLLIPDRLTSPATIEQQVLGKNADIRTPDAGNGSALPELEWRSCDAIIAWHEVELTESVIKMLDSCQVIVRCGVGYDNVDIQTAGARGIPVCNVPDYGTNDVADHALGLLLALSRGLVAFNSLIKLSDDNWAWDAFGPLRRISGSSLGIIGLGRIGTAVARRAQSFGLSVIFYDPYVPDGQDKALGVKRCRTMKELLNQSDIVSLHVPLTEETAGMVNNQFFDQLKKDALLINTARGGLIDIDALHTALKSGHLRGAGLDVFPTEPPDSEHLLIRAWRDPHGWAANRLIVTPHSAFFNEESHHEMRNKAATTVKEVWEGNPPRNCVNNEWLRQT